MNRKAADQGSATSAAPARRSGGVQDPDDYRQREKASSTGRVVKGAHPDKARSIASRRAAQRGAPARGRERPAGRSQKANRNGRAPAKPMTRRRTARCHKRGRRQRRARCDETARTIASAMRTEARWPDIGLRARSRADHVVLPVPPPAREEVIANSPAASPRRVGRRPSFCVKQDSTANRTKEQRRRSNRGGEREQPGLAPSTTHTAETRCRAGSKEQQRASSVATARERHRAGRHCPRRCLRRAGRRRIDALRLCHQRTSEDLAYS